MTHLVFSIRSNAPYAVISTTGIVESRIATSAYGIGEKNSDH
jgi:hypothetical protein